ncbi:MAG: hypothetical protein IK004_01040 [Bacteroidales bacterium]|nr:hypothetical protein [Bacteroidales bacterium]
MRQLRYVILVSLAVMMASCTGNHTMKREPHLSDTLYTAKAAMEIYDYNPNRALVILDSAEIVGNISHDRASFYRAKVFTMTLQGMHLDSAQKICQSLMNSNYIKNVDNHESVLDLLIAITRRKQDFEQWMKWSTEKAELCRKYGNEVEALRTEAEVGVILAFLGREKESLQKLDNVIEKLDRTRKFNEMDACIIALRRKVDVLSELGRYEEIIPIAQKIIEKTIDYEQHPDEYSDGSFREPSAANVPDYCDFYRVKAFAYLARAYAETDDIANARQYLTLFEQSRYGQTFDGRMMISMTWCKLGDYDKMLAVYDEVVNYLKDDTISENYSTILYNRAIAAEARGQYALANSYIKRHAELNQLISSQLQESKANEYAARYRAQEQQMEIDHQTLLNRMQNIIIILLFVALMVIVFFYNNSVFQKKKMTEKNAALVKLIDEKTKQNKMLANLKENIGDDNRLMEACRILREQPDMKVTEVAKKVGLSPNDLQKLFRERFSMSLAEYKLSHKK